MNFPESVVAVTFPIILETQPCALEAKSSDSFELAQTNGAPRNPFNHLLAGVKTYSSNTHVIL
jgi:hypothetical protein